MAASKKPTKSAVKKTSVKATVHKAPAKKSTNKKSATQKTYTMRSFRIEKDNPPFTTFKITRQTVYWVILICFIIFAQLWIIKLQIDVSNLIELQQQALQD